MNISDRGNVCIDILKHNWSPALSLFKVMLSLSSLLTDPNPRESYLVSFGNHIRPFTCVCRRSTG
jgi:ubiquitin-protein ligase